MIERIKTAFSSSITWIIGLLALVFYLFEKNKDTEGKLASSEAEGKLKDGKEQQAHIDDAANNAVSFYDELRKRYIRGMPSSDQSVRSGTKGQGRTDKDQGPEDGPGGDAA